MRELSVTEQRYKAVLAVISNGRTVTEVARDWNVSRQTLHQWLGRYEEEGFVGLANRSHRPVHCPHQIAPILKSSCPRCPGSLPARARSPRSGPMASWAQLWPIHTGSS